MGKPMPFLLVRLDISRRESYNELEYSTKMEGEFHMFKKILSLVLSLIILVSVAVPAGAADSNVTVTLNVDFGKITETGWNTVNNSDVSSTTKKYSRQIAQNQPINLPAPTPDTDRGGYIFEG